MLRLARFLRGGGEAYGAVTDGGIVDLSARGRVSPAAPGEALSPDALRELAGAAEGETPDFSEEEVEFLPFLPRPEKIFCIGVNYANRNEEYRDNAGEKSYPSVFMRTPDSFSGHGQALLRPPESQQLDYEGELVIVIGRAGRRIPEEAAHGHIAGLTLCNEGTLRDWVRHAKFNVTQGKNFERSGAIGPWMVPAWEFPSFGHLDIKTRVNGELRQNDNTENMIFSFARLIHYLSSFTRLKAGDVIISGTPTGAGARFDPPRYLKPGDVVEVENSVIGTLANEVKDELGP